MKVAELELVWLFFRKKIVSSKKKCIFANVAYKKGEKKNEVEISFF